MTPSAWHPMMVHFPLALTVTGALVLTAARLPALGSHSPTLATVGTLNLVLGAAALFLAVGTGLAAVASLDLPPASRAAVGLHVKWALFTSCALLLIAVWRGAGARWDARPTGMFLVMLWIVTAALVMTGYRGGENVYRYGVGVMSTAPHP